MGDNVIKKILLATVLLMCSTVPAAQAYWDTGSIRHYAPDNGYDAPILVQCANGTKRNIYEGQHSDDRCADEDAERVYVPQGVQIDCWSDRNGGHWVNTFDSTGWHGVNNFWNFNCVVMLDKYL